MDTESFKSIFLPCHQKLYRVAFRLLGNACDAEDIVQEAYLKLWNKRDELDKVNNPESFSVVVLKNLCYDHLRSNKEDALTLPESFDIGQSGSLIKDIEAKSELDQVKQLIFELPPQQQKVMVLRHIDDCSLQEIEEITGLNAINVRTLLSRARKKIRNQFELLNCR